MKRICALFLAMLLTVSLSACGKSFSGSRMGSDNELIMKYSMFNTTDSQSLRLEKGDIINADIVNNSGRLSIKIQKGDEPPIYENRDVSTGTFQVEIEEGGTYQATVKGEHAQGGISLTTETGGHSMQPAIDSYYEAQSSEAFQMFNKSIFRRFADDWTQTAGDYENPEWNYDSFTEYSILDGNMEPADGNNQLYYCTFSADNEKYGYVIIRFEGEGISKIDAVETPYLYDLQENMEAVKEGLKESDVDLSTCVASRVRLMNVDKTAGEEAILVTDDQGHSYVFRFSGQPRG